MAKYDYNYGEFKSGINSIKSARNSLQNINIKKMNSYNYLKVDEQINDAMSKLFLAADEADTDLRYVENILKKLSMKLETWDNESDSKTEHKYTSSKKTKKKKKSKKKKVYGFVSGIKSFIPPIIQILPVPLTPTVNIRVQMLQDFEKSLQSGNLSAATSLYKTLTTFGSKEDADKMLSKYGYKVKTENGEYVIYKEEIVIPTEPETPLDNDVNSDSSNTDINVDNSNTNNDSNSTDTEVVAPEQSNNDNISQNEQSGSNDISQNNQNNNSNVNTNNTVNNNVNINNGQNSNANVRPTVNEQVNSNVSGNDNVSTNQTVVEKPEVGIPEKPIDDINKDKPITSKPSTNNVVTIEDEGPSTARKSSGLGTAIPIGIGVAATGAAAVAGVRYVKNKHNNQEEYDESYDDENNDLDSNDSYTDSAQYDNSSSEDYTDDEYLGPAGSTYTDAANLQNDEAYVDFEDLEEELEEDFSNDVVLEQLNSNI